VESSEDAIIGQTLDGTIVTWNAGAEQLYGYAFDEVVGRSVALLAPKDRASELPQILERLWRGERVANDEIFGVRKDGTDVWDAFASDRPYRPAWVTARARGDIRAQAGSQFDPEAAQTFLQVPSEDVA